MSFILEICHDLLYTSMQIKMDDVIVVSVYGLHWNLREERNIRKFSYIFTYSLNIYQVKASATSFGPQRFQNIC